MEKKWRLCQYWICDAIEMFELRICIAKKNDNQTVYTFAINELFDLSSEKNYYDFFQLETYRKSTIIHEWRFQKWIKEYRLVGLEMMK